MDKVIRCDKCGSMLITYWISGTIPWIVCPVCDKAEIEASTKKDESEPSA